MSQGSLNVPITGPVTPTAFAGDINTALDAVVSKNSGGSAPSNFPTSPGAATVYQDWADTSPGGGIVDEKEFDGSSWLRKGAQDQTNHVWMPIVGGGSGTIAAGATTDIGSVRQGYMTVTGAVPGTPITSFGSNALLTVGESKFLRFTAAGIITYNATSMILPGAADLSFNAGDTIQAVYLGSGNWLCYDYTSGLSAEGRNTGDLFQKWGSPAIPGAVKLNGGTMGNGASGGTERANADTVNLFIYLYINDTSLSVSGGRTAPGNTRAAAITDFNLNKTITLPNRAEIGVITTTPLTSGSSTYNTPANCKSIRVRMCGGGGGGSAQNTNNGSAGTDTTFAGGTWTAKGGGGGIVASSGGAGGTGGANGSGTLVTRVAGGNGSAAPDTAGVERWGGQGGNNPFGGGAGATARDQNGIAGAANTGGGGGGAAFNSGVSGIHGAGGGASEYVEFIITNPAASFTYAVGGGGNGGAAGAHAGGNGGSGVIIIDEYCSLGQQYAAL